MQFNDMPGSTAKRYFESDESVSLVIRPATNCCLRDGILGLEKLQRSRSVERMEKRR